MRIITRKLFKMIICKRKSLIEIYYFRIPSAFRSFIYCTVIREGDESEWNWAAYRFAKESSATERQNLVKNLCLIIFTNNNAIVN